MAQESNNHADYFCTFCIFPIAALPNRAHIGRINPAPLWGHRTKAKAMNFRFTAAQQLVSKLHTFRAVNKLDARRYRAATAALGFLNMAELAYCPNERRAYVVKAQNAFRLAFL